jgi:hypothetical protein
MRATGTVHLAAGSKGPGERWHSFTSEGPPVRSVRRAEAHSRHMTVRYGGKR